MGVKLTDLLKPKKIELKDLKDKVIAIDASLFLYQFITTIRQRDGSLLKDSNGNVTSHLSGLFSRTVNLMRNGLKLVYVFDGEMPELKRKERERRSKLKDEAELLYEKAVQEGNIELMRKYGARTARLTPEMVNESKELLTGLGIPIVQAKSEAEAQASYMVKKGDCYAVATQDNDVFMFGANRVIKNLSILGKRKKIRALKYEVIKPELVELDNVLNTLGMDNDQLIVLGMLVGTDFNIGGIKGIGPKNGVKLVKK